MLGGHCEVVSRQHGEVGQFAGFDGSLDSFLTRKPCVVDRHHSQDSVARGDRLVGSVDAVRYRVARDEVVHHPERAKRDHRRIGTAGKHETFVQVGLHWRDLRGTRHAPIALQYRRGKIEMILYGQAEFELPDARVLVGAGNKRVLYGPPILGDVFLRVGKFQALKYFVDRRVAHCMHGSAPAHPVEAGDIVIKSRLVDSTQAEVFAAVTEGAFISLCHEAAFKAPIDCNLDAPHPHPVVALVLLDAGIEHAALEVGQVARPDQDAVADRSPAGIAQLLKFPVVCDRNTWDTNAGETV